MPKQALHLDLTHASIPCASRHQLVLQAWDLLEPGTHFTIRTDHDPVPLRQLLERQAGTQIRWEYLESGPCWFTVQILREG